MRGLRVILGLVLVLAPIVTSAEDIQDAIRSYEDKMFILRTTINRSIGRLQSSPGTSSAKDLTSHQLERADSILLGVQRDLSALVDMLRLAALVTEEQARVRAQQIVDGHREFMLFRMSQGNTVVTTLGWGLDPETRRLLTEAQALLREGMALLGRIQW
jgi:hypothetical protein